MSTNALSALTDWVDRHKRGLSYVFYAGAAAGVATILHSVRAVSQSASSHCLKFPPSFVTHVFSVLPFQDRR